MSAKRKKKQGSNGIMGFPKQPPKNNGKHPGGRPSKYPQIDLTQVEVFGEIGLTDVEIAKCLGVSEVTLNAYKKKYPEFLKSLKVGKERADEQVIASLYKRATGYSCPDVSVNVRKIDRDTEEVVVTPLIKHFPPDPTSIIFWLTNRQPDKWKRNMGASIQLPEDDDRPIVVKVIRGTNADK